MSEQKTILIVEDEVAQARALEKKLTNAGYQVLVTHNGEDGLEMALSKHPDLILLDVVMPKKDGVSLLEDLREDEWGKTVDVIVLTNLGFAEKQRRALQWQIQDYLVKAEWKMEDILKKIEATLSIKK